VAKAKLHIDVERAAAVGAQFGRMKGQLDKEMEQSISETAEALKRVYRFWAPKRSGRLQKGIRAFKSGKAQIDMVVTGVTSESGYNYVAVTRFGHRAATILPKNNLVLKLDLGHGFWTFAPQVKGYNPEFDWVEEAFFTAQAVAEHHAKALSTRLQLRLMQ
jgi:hypothetical protein